MSPLAVTNKLLETALAVDAQKPVLYILSEFHPTSVAYAESLFDCIHYDDPLVLKWRSHATAILIKDYYITRSDLEVAPHLRIIGKQGVGIEKIDAVACAEHNVQIFNTPGVNAGAVAEMTMALALSVARKIPGIWVRQVVDGETIRKETCTGLLLTGKTIGIVGMGNIGRAVAKMFVAAFDANVVVYDKHMPDDPHLWRDIPHTRVWTLEEVLKPADVITVHVPLTEETAGMISHAQFALMKKNAILINTARGGIIDEAALREALIRSAIWGAGLDCHEQEPPTREKYQDLWTCGNIVGTPHIAAATDETQIATTNAAIDGIYKFVSTFSGLSNAEAGG
ncbi:D-isomer specific 2-hydroxyacid dehydrogenase [Bisporella sp. PMI_857]|nr:D-isomer specific 2-hydroxyacid dehydrogenase [Bisporella sp. PMI_857]